MGHRPSSGGVWALSSDCRQTASHLSFFHGATRIAGSKGTDEFQCEFAVRPRGRFAVTPWFRLTLICCVLLCLLLGLTQAIYWNYQPVVSSGSSFDRGTKATSDSPISSVVENMAFDLAHVRPFGSLVLDRGRLRAILVRPAGGTAGHRSRWALASCRQLKPTPSSNLPHQITGSQPKN